MSQKVVKEFNVDTVWGKIAMITWGDPSNTPVLMVHGYMDSAATFVLLVDQLPDDYYYVAFDMPGHGKSDPFQPGLVISALHLVEVIRIIVEHMKWEQFIYLAHSMGCVVGIFYNHLFPAKISKMIQLDPGPPLSMYYFVNYRPTYWYKFIFNDYYGHYQKWISNDSKLYTHEEAINLLVRSRSLSEEQSEIVISRNLVPVGDKYKLSWEPRMKRIATVPVSEDTLYHVISINVPPTLTIEATESNYNTREAKKFAANILEKCEQFVPHHYIVKVEGGHDIHITNPEALVPSIKEFLNRHYDTEVLTKSKL